jgi:uncharacterized protein YndB with AHSA1/START domain
MTDASTIDAFGRLSEPTTLVIERLLPGPIERVWAFLTEDGLRRKWLAAGEMPLRTGASFTLTWRNDELTDPPGARPAGFGAEERMESRVLAVDPPHRLAFAWGEGDVTMTLAARADRVLLTVVHRRITERPSRVMIGAGWHAHLDLLATRLAETAPDAPFWDVWTALRDDYERRMPR